VNLPLNAGREFVQKRIVIVEALGHCKTRCSL
jgi:hypothetical protein